MQKPPRPTDTTTPSKSKSNGDQAREVAASSGGIPREFSLTDEFRLNADTTFSIVKRFCATLKATGETLFLTDQIESRLEEFLAGEMTPEVKESKAVRRFFRGCCEILLAADAAYAVLRPGIGRKRIVCIHPDLPAVEEVSRGRFLQMKDAHVQGWEMANKQGLVLDFSPFFRDFPKVTDASEMGQGISFLNRRLAAQLNENPEVFRRELLEFLRSRQLGGISILANDHLVSPSKLLEELSAVRSLLEDCEATDRYADVAHALRVHGFESGWGSTVADINDNLNLLSQVFESADPTRLERFLSRLPLVRTVLMVSPHGWFAQDGVLGRPDTGGQVTYVLDQALAIEKELRLQYERAGVSAAPKVAILTRLIPNSDGTTCNIAREKIHGTEDSWIIRAPFREVDGEVVADWISRFRIWPYLESFAEESKNVVVTELMGAPDLIIGHYTDGNLVAHRLADDLGTTHCACIHALEKTKYLFSDMHWEGFESDYHFSMQFTADLIAYNAADYIVSSSYREIGGTSTEMGMIEAYELFSLPGLYRVQSGLDPRLARHNIVPPGASQQYFFPSGEEHRRVHAITRLLEEEYLGRDPKHGSVGHLENPDLPIVFAMARLDKIKNLSGLVEIFGRHQRLREVANLLLVTSVNRVDQSSDHEEIDEVNRTYELIEQYGLDGHIRWCAARLDKVQTGEIYRIIADRRGVFAQPAFMETFGLTVIEAMACGLPVVVTCFGGPSEIVVSEVSGEMANPNDQDQFAAALLRVVTDSQRWQSYHHEGIERVNSAFTWRKHAGNILSLANIYGYWNHLDVMNRQALDRYLHTLYHTVYRPRTEALRLGAS